MDVVALDDGEVYYEKPVETKEVAEKPELILEAVSEAFPLDLLVGPSGYGVELTRIEEIEEGVFKDWYYNYILLTRSNEIEDAVKRGVFGAMVYYAMTESATLMRKRGWPVVYIPAVIHLPTVPEHRKINKLDMGTADKMSVAVLGVHDQSSRFGISYPEVSFLLVEMGFGYNAVIGVDRGQIVDGAGGTTIGGPGFLTAASMDFELVQLVGRWEKADVFAGGASSITGKPTPEELVSRAREEEKCGLAWEAMIESVEKAVASVGVSVPKPKEILLSGRLMRIERVKAELADRLSRYAPVRGLGSLEGAKLTKETAQGYAMIGDGIGGGRFKGLIDWMRIKEARGTAFDHIYHPKFDRSGFVPFKAK